MSVRWWVLNWVICFSLGSEYAGAQNPFGFTEIAPSAHANALGGNQISYSGKESYTFLQNPALLDTTVKGQVAATYSPYFSGHYTAISYVLKNKKDYTVGVFAQSLGFGKFVETDNIGTVTGQFGVGNFQAGAGLARKIDRISFGLNLRFVNAVFASYWSSAVVMDWGGTFELPEKGLNLSLVARNIGFSLNRSPYVDGQLPFNLLLGLSLKPRFMPARIHAVFNELSEWRPENIRGARDLSVSQQIFSHLAVGADVFLGRSVYFTVSNNFKKSLGEGGHILSGYGLGLSLDISKALLSVSHAANPSFKNQTVFSLAYKF